MTTSTATIAPRTDHEALDRAAAYAQTLVEGAVERDRQGRAPVEQLSGFAARGLLTLTVPAALGGPELSYATLAGVVATVAAVDASIAQTSQGHFYALQMILEDGTAAQRQRFADEVLRGARIGNALSERRTAHAAEMRTRLVRRPDGGFRLDGEKYYSTGALGSDWIAVQAVDEDGHDVAVFVPSGAAGVEVHEDWNALGQRSTGSGTSVYAAVVVDAGAVVPHWRTFTRPTLFGSVGQIIHAAVDVGIAVGALDAAGAFVRERSRPHFEAHQRGWEQASDDPFSVQRFGQLATQVRAARALLAEAGRAMDAARDGASADGTLPTQAIAEAAAAVGAAKAYAGDVALEVSGELFSLGGTRTSDPAHGLDRYWRDARTHTLHDPNRWKYFHVGNHALNGTPLPNNGLH